VEGRKGFRKGGKHEKSFAFLRVGATIKKTRSLNGYSHVEVNRLADARRFSK
jgi:hypothetical protein